MENRVNFSISPIGNSVDFYFKSHKKSIYSISNTLLIVEDCKYTCPGLGCAGYVVGVTVIIGLVSVQLVLN